VKRGARMREQAARHQTAYCAYPLASLAPRSARSPLGSLPTRFAFHSFHSLLH